MVRKIVRTEPQSWPPDPKHKYALWLETGTPLHALARAYVTAHPIYRDVGVHSRFAVRLDLPGTYRRMSDAAPDGFAIARRFFHGHFSPLGSEVVKVAKGYCIVASARFRIDCHLWEPTLLIRCERPQNKGAVQTFDGAQSPFISRTCETSELAANVALAYGERVVLGLVPGLRV